MNLKVSKQDEHPSLNHPEMSLWASTSDTYVLVKCSECQTWAARSIGEPGFTWNGEHTTSQEAVRDLVPAPKTTLTWE